MDNTLTLDETFKQKYNIKNIIKNIEGGQKNVFIVELASGENVVIKIFHSFDNREKKEVELYKKYEHLSGIPKIIEVSEHAGKVILVEEYIEGTSLEEIFKTGYYFNDREKIVSLLKNIINILKPIWEDGLVHRDLKPENIIIKPDYKPVIIDFGIVKDSLATTITETGFQPNSWKFASPEQIFAKKEQISYRTDFFSLGVIGYYLYYNKLPFGNSKEDVRDNLSNPDSFCVNGENCVMKESFNQICKINPSERPRNVELLLKLL